MGLEHHISRPIEIVSMTLMTAFFVLSTLGRPRNKQDFPMPLDLKPPFVIAP